MADSTKPLVVELSIEFVVELILFLYPYGAEQMNMPHNFWLGLGCWTIGTAIAIRMFWIFPLWASRMSRLEKALIAFILLALLIAVLRRPVMIAYGKRNAEAEVKMATASTQQSAGATSVPQNPNPQSQPQAPATPSTRKNQPTKGQSATVAGEGSNNTAGNIQQNGNGNNAAVGSNNDVGNTYNINQGPQLSGWLVPGHEPIPLLPVCGAGVTDRPRGNKVPDGYFALFFGGNVDIEQKFPMTIIQVADQPRLVLEKKDSGEIAVNLDIFDSDPKPRIIASIEHNEFTVNPNNYFKVIKSADKSRLVVVDQYKTTVLDVRYTNKQSMSINAVLHFPGVPDPLVIGDNEIMWRNSPIYANCSHDFGAGTPVIDILPTKSLATSASAGLTLR